MRLILISISLFLTTSALGCICSRYEFNSLQDIEKYQFIGLVKIDSIYILPEDTIRNQISYHTSFSIIELYRGDSLNELQVSGGNHNLNIRRHTSCDIGLDPGEEWIIFAYVTPDSTLQTGYCTFSKLYRSKTGLRDWHYRRGFEEIEKVKKLLDIKDVIKPELNGEHIDRYPNGLIEVESQYKSGLLHGTRKIRYQNGSLMIKEDYVNGLRNGESVWFYENGTLKRKYTYQNSQPIDSCWNYHENGQVSRKTFYAPLGQELYSVSFSKEGHMTSKYTADTLKNESIQTKYFDTGEVRSISQSEIGEYLNRNTTQYYQNGQVEGIWTYFSEGDLKSEVKIWSENGELIFHQQTNWQRERTVLINKTDNKNRTP